MVKIDTKGVVAVGYRAGNGHHCNEYWLQDR